MNKTCNVAEQDRDTVREPTIARPPTRWRSENLLDGIEAPALRRRRHDLDLIEPVLWNDLCSEYDARFMEAHIRRRLPDMSKGLPEVLAKWAADEANHFVGFRRIYSLLFGAGQAHVDQRLAERRPDFAVLDRFFENEFALCVLLAFDEIVTARAYRDDFAFYDSFEVAGLSRWIRSVAADEGLHFGAFARHVREHSGFSAQEKTGLVREVLDVDLGKTAYLATFVLDHTGPQFTPNFLQDCSTKLLIAMRL